MKIQLLEKKTWAAINKTDKLYSNLTFDFYKIISFILTFKNKCTNPNFVANF